MISKGSMSASRSGTRATSRSIPTSPLEAISERRRGQARPRRGPAARRAARARAARASTPCSFFSANGSPTWTVGRLSLVGLAELGAGEHRRAADAVAARRGAEEDEHVADAGRGRSGSCARVSAEAERHRVDQAVLLVGRLEVDLAADRRHADRVAVVPDARDGAVEQVARALRRVGSPKRSESSTAIGRAPIAKMSRRMPADAGGRALEGLDRARVVVRLDLEGARPARRRRRPRPRSRPAP